MRESSAFSRPDDDEYCLLSFHCVLDQRRSLIVFCYTAQPLYCILYSVYPHSGIMILCGHLTLNLKCFLSVILAKKGQLSVPDPCGGTHDLHSCTHVVQHSISRLPINSLQPWICLHSHHVIVCHDKWIFCLSLHVLCSTVSNTTHHSTLLKHKMHTFIGCHGTPKTITPIWGWK